MKRKIKKKALPNYIDKNYDFDFNERDIEDILKDIDSDQFNEFEEELIEMYPDSRGSELTPKDIKLMDEELEFFDDDLDDIETLDPKYVFEELDSGWINDEFDKSANAKMFLKIAGSPIRSTTAIIRAFEGALGSLSDVNFSDSTYFWKLDNNDAIEFCVKITDSDIVFKLICGSKEISDSVKWDNKYINYEVGAFTDVLLKDASEFLEYIDMDQLNELDIDSREYDSITDDLHSMASKLSNTNGDFMGLSDFDDGSEEEGNDSMYVSASDLSRLVSNFNKLALLNIDDELVSAFRGALESVVYSSEDNVSYSEHSSGDKHSWIIKNKDLGARVNLELDFDTESAGGGKAKFVVGYHFGGDEFNKEFIVELNDLRAFKQAADRLRDAGGSMTKNFSELMDSLAREVESTGDSLKGFEEDAPETVREYSFPDWDDVTEVTEMKFSSKRYRDMIRKMAQDWDDDYNEYQHEMSQSLRDEEDYVLEEEGRNYYVDKNDSIKEAIKMLKDAVEGIESKTGVHLSGYINHIENMLIDDILYNNDRLGTIRSPQSRDKEENKDFARSLMLSSRKNANLKGNMKTATGKYLGMRPYKELDKMEKVEFLSRLDNQVMDLQFGISRFIVDGKYEADASKLNWELSNFRHEIERLEDSLKVSRRSDNGENEADPGYNDELDESYDDNYVDDFKKDSVAYYKLSNMVKSASMNLKSSNKRGSRRR